MQQSPYFTGAAPNFGPPGGMASLISQDRSSQMDTNGFKQFADVAEKFKRQQDAGKAADFFVKASQQPDGTNPVLDSMGIHPEQWKTLGAGDKTNAVQGIVQAQAQKNVLQQYADVAAQAQERQAQAQSMQDTGTFLKSYAADLPDGIEDTPQNRLKNALKSLPPGANIGRVFPQAMNSLDKFATIGQNSRKQFFNPTDPMAQDIPGLPGGKRVVTGPNTSEIKLVNTDAPEAPPGYFAASDGKGGWKYLKLNPASMTEEQRTKVTASYEKNIDDLLKSYAFAKGDPEMEQMFKDRIAAHQQAIKVLNTPAGGGTPQFKSPEEVKAAVTSGAIGKEAALKILQTQFGMK